MSTTSAIPSTSSPAQSRARSTSSTNSLYALASRVPLISSPSVSLPRAPKLPPNLHPLPTDISAYFVYSFSLESYVLDPNTPSSTTIDQLLAKHKQYLEAREREKQERERELLRRMAPGWQGASGVLMPTSTAKKEEVTRAEPTATGKGVEQEEQKEERTPLDDLADHLAQLDALHSQGAPRSS